MLDERQQILIADLVEKRAIAEGMRFGVEIVEVGDALGRRFRIVATRAIQVAPLLTLILLKAKREFINSDFDALATCAFGRRGNFVPAGNAPNGERSGELPVRSGYAPGGLHDCAVGRTEPHRGPTDRCAVSVIDLHYDGLLQRRSDGCQLFATAHFHDRGRRSRRRFGNEWRGRTGTVRQHKTEGHDPHGGGSHLPFASCPFCAIRKAVSALASASLICRSGSIVPWRSDCGALSH